MTRVGTHGVRTVESVEDLDQLPSARLREHLRFELDLVIQDLGSQAELAKILGYSGGQSGVSKILNRHVDLSVNRARKLDNEGCRPTVQGVTFLALVEAIERAEGSGPLTDVFLAVPMSASRTKYKSHRTRALDLVHTLEAKGLSVYFAGREITSIDDFDDHQIAFIANLDHLKTSRQFVLYLPRALQGQTPSSVWVELGVAIGRELPCTLLVPDKTSLPYIISRSLEDHTEGLSILVREHGDDPDKPIRLLRRHGLQLLAQGNLRTPNHSTRRG